MLPNCVKRCFLSVTSVSDTEFLCNEVDSAALGMGTRQDGWGSVIAERWRSACNSDHFVSDIGSGTPFGEDSDKNV